MGCCADFIKVSISSCLKQTKKNHAETAGFFPSSSISVVHVNEPIAAAHQHNQRGNTPQNDHRHGFLLQFFCPVATMHSSRFLFQFREDSAIGTIRIVANSKSD